MIDTGEMTPLVHVSGMLGNYRGNTAWIAPLAWHSTNTNAVIVCDLSGDIQGLVQEPVEVLRQRLYTKKSELEAEGILPVPLKLVHINKCPIIAPAKTLLPENAERLGIDRALCLENLKLLKAHKSLVRDKVIEIFAEDRQFAKSDNVELSLYDGFFSPADKNNMAILRELPPEALANHALKFADERVEKLLFHYRARHFPETLNRAEQIRWQKYCLLQIEQRAQAFSQSIERLYQVHFDDAEKCKLLDELTAYASQLAQQMPIASTQSTKASETLVEELNAVAEKSVDKTAKFEALNALLGQRKKAS